MQMLVFLLAAAGFFIKPELLEIRVRASQRAMMSEILGIRINLSPERDPRIACAVHPASIAILVIAIFWNIILVMRLSAYSLNSHQNQL